MYILEVTRRVVDVESPLYSQYKSVVSLLESYTISQINIVHDYIKNLNIANKDNPLGVALIINDPRILYTHDGLEAQLKCMNSDGYHNDTLLPARIFYVGFDEDDEPMLYTFEVAYNIEHVNKVVYSFADVQMPTKAYARQARYLIVD